MKAEYEPILSPGIHDRTLTQVEKDFVKSFGENPRRAQLFERFTVFLRSLVATGVVTEVWIDGSFLTKKETPDDIDAVVFFDANKTNNLAPQELKTLIYLIGDPAASKIRFLTDVRAVPDNDTNLRSYWRGWFGFTRTETAKGFVRVSLLGVLV